MTFVSKEKSSLDLKFHTCIVRCTVDLSLLSALIVILPCGFAFETSGVSFERKPRVNETKISLYGQIRTMDSSYDWKSEDWLENHFVISCPVIDEFLTTTLPGVEEVRT